MNNTKKNNIDCDIVCDLLPLYYDNVVSETTSAAVEEHLKECEECSREYDSLFSKIPQKETVSTKDSFNKMMKIKRRKQRLVTALISVICCTVLAAGYYVLSTVPLIEVKDVEVHKVYRYEGKNEDKFFVLYSNEDWNGARWYSQVSEKDGKTVYAHTLKRPVISEKRTEIWVDCTSYGAVRLSDSRKRKVVETDCDELVYCGNTVWTKAENGSDKIPDYVYAFEEYENGNQDEFGDSDSIAWLTGVNPKDIDGSSNYLGIQHPDFRIVKWNLDGDVIFDSLQKEETNEKTTDS